MLPSTFTPKRKKVKKLSIKLEELKTYLALPHETYIDFSNHRKRLKIYKQFI